MKRFDVEYEVRHRKEFWVQDESQIHDILNEYNQCKVISIKEPPVDLSITTESE